MGVTFIVDVTEALPPLVAVKAGVLPVPLAAKPIVGSELVQAKVPPAGLLVNADAVTFPPLQTVILAGTVTVGTAFTVMFSVSVFPQAPGIV